MNNTNNRGFNGLRVEKVKFERGLNNCYTYAINQVKNPYTGRYYSDYAYCQPGILGGVGESYSDDNYAEIPQKVKEDLDRIGYTIRESTYEEYAENPKAWKIAFCYTKKGDRGVSQDYHFYRQNKNGTWSHKSGAYDVRKVDASGNIIYNPETCDRGRYKIFGGFYIISPKRLDN